MKDKNGVTIQHGMRGVYAHPDRIPMGLTGDIHLNHPANKLVFIPVDNDGCFFKIVLDEDACQYITIDIPETEEKEMKKLKDKNGVTIKDGMTGTYF